MITLDKRNLAPLDVSVGSSQKPKQDASAPAPAPQKGSPNADPNAMAVDEPTPSSATRTEPPASLPPALVRRDTRSGRRKSVRWVDEDQVMPSAVDSPEDSIFVSDETQRPASALDVASPSEIPRPPTPPRGYKKASQAGGASQEGAKQSVPVLCLVGNKSAKPTMFVFKGIPQQAAHPWLQDFQSRQSLTFRHTCTAADFGSQFRGERASLFPNLAQGSVFALSDAAALDSLYLWLKLPARGLMFYADTYCVLAFPADAPEWGLEAPDVSRTDGPLKFIVFEHQFSEFDLETRTDEKAICHDHLGWESWLPRGLGSFSAFESQTVLPPNTPPTARPQVFLAFPPGAIEESRLVAQWFPIASRSECVIYDSLSPGTWAEFLKAGHGAIVVHEDALWKIRLFPGMFDILDQAASGKYVISVFRRGCGGNEVTAEWSAGRPVTGDVSIQPIFPAGKAFFMTPSFIVTQPQQANLFVGFFVKSYGGPEATHRGVLIVPADFEDWLVDLIVERSKKPVNKDKETHKRDMMALDRLLEYVSRLDAPTSEEDMGSPLVYAPKTLDASDEQSLVNWFGWWTMANMNHIGRFYVIGSRAEPADRATRQLRIVNYHSKEPDVDPKGTTKNIPEGPSRRLPESPVRRPSQSRILRDDALETIREHLFVLSDRMHKTFHLMLFYYIPVTHWDVEKDWLKGARNRDYGASYKQWFDYYFPFDPARPAAETKNFNNTYGGFFYTSEDGRDTTELEGRDRDGGRGRNGRAVATLRPWLAFFRPVNPHRKPWREVELMILDTGYQGKIGCNDEVHEEQLIEAQRHLLAVVNQRNRDKNPHMPLTKVWLGGWDDNLVSDYTDPLDKTLAHLERCVAEVRVWLPAPANSLESRGWKLVREAGTAPQRDGSEPMDLDTDDEHGGHPAGRSQKTTRNSGKSGDDDGFGDEDDDDDDDVSQDGSDVDYVSRKKRVFAAPRRRTDPGAPGSLCTNALFQRCKGAKERRDTTMQYTYPATKAWYEKQVAEGRDYKHIMVDSWDKVFVKLHLPVNEA